MHSITGFVLIDTRVFEKIGGGGVLLPSWTTDRQ